MHITKKLRLLTTIGASAAALSFGLIAPTAGGASTSHAVKGTLTYAESPGASPNYIFPYMGCSFFSVNNINQFQELMYRPLYWFGLKASAAVVDGPQIGAEAKDGLSMAAAPVMSHSNSTVTMNLGNYKFASGQAVNGESVQFFLNMYKSDPTSYCGYNTGFGIPDQVKSVSHTATSVTINFTTPVNPNWILYNYLSEITPFPTTWDTTGTGAEAGCATGAYGTKSTDTACKAVEAYLDAQSAKSTTYTGKLWQSGVDGPYKLTAFDALGNATFVPNPTYAGPQKSQVAVVKELAFASTTAEDNALRGGTIDLGYVDPSELTSPAPGPLQVGANWSQVASKYNLTTGSSWGFSYADYNFNPKSPEAKFLQQLYIRQVLQYGVNQPGIISKIDKGYALENFSPLPYGVAPSIGTQPTELYAYNLKAAATLLKDHGWVKAGGGLECVNPGASGTECGVGIAKGDKLTVTFLYGGGVTSFSNEVNTILSAWRSLGINAIASVQPFNSVISACAAGKTNWSICDWGAGWIYAPDYYPSGEWGFTPGAGFNIGHYSNAKMTSLINATTFGTTPLTAYAAYFQTQLPVMFQPNGEGTGEILKTVKSTIGFASNPLQNFNPEYFSL